MQTANKLQEENAFLKVQLAQSTQQLEQKNHYIQQLEEALKQQRHQHFGVSSEKVHPDQLGLFNEAESALESGSKSQDNQ